MSKEELIREMLALSIDDRLDLFGILGDSLGPIDPYPPLSEEWKAEINRRLEEHDRDPSSSIPAEDVYRELGIEWPPEA